MSKLIRYFQSVAKYILVVWVLFIIVFSSIPSPRLPEINFKIYNLEIRMDYIAHFIEYVTLSFLALFSFMPHRFRSMKKRFCIIISLLVIFALAFESHQLLIPGRSFSPSDIFSNILGIIAGTVLTGIIYRMSFREENN